VGSITFYTNLFNIIKRIYEEDLKLEIKIITFNYDTSLEIFMRQVFSAEYGINEDEAQAKLDNLYRICHFYGSIDNPWHEKDCENFINNPKSWADNASKRLKLIRDDENELEYMKDCQEWIKQSDLIAFHGFGYDPTNLRRLGMSEYHDPNKTLIGTCIGANPPASIKGLRRIHNTKDFYTIINEDINSPMANS